MAAVTNLLTHPNTSNTNSYVSASATPSNGDLLVCIACATGETSTDWTVTDSLGGTWTKIRRQVKNSSGDIMEVWVRNSLSNGSALTVTYSHASGNATGSIKDVLKISGMTRTGASAVRSQGGQDNQAAASTPAPALNQAALTGNPVITAILSATGPPGVTVPTGFTQRQNDFYGTPTTGEEVASVDSGFTSSTVTWGGTSASAYCSVAIELDTSAPPSSTPSKLKTMV